MALHFSVRNGPERPYRWELHAKVRKWRAELGKCRAGSGNVWICRQNRHGILHHQRTFIYNHWESRSKHISCALSHVIPVPLWFHLSSDAPLRRVRRPRCLADCGGRRVRTDVTSHLNTRPACRGHGCGCPLPATEFVAQRCPLVVDPMCRKPGSDDIDAVQRKHRNEQMALDPLAQLVPDRAQPEFGLERPECRFQFSQAPVGANRILSAPLRVAGAQDQGVPTLSATSGF